LDPSTLPGRARERAQAWRRRSALACVAALAAAALWTVNLARAGGATPEPVANVPPVTPIEPAPARHTVSYPGRAMGTYFNVTLVTDDSLASESTALAAHREFARLDSLMSNWTTTSEVARINREAGRHPTTVEPEVAEVLDRSLDTWRHSDHAFDITVEPMMRAWGFLGGHPHVPSPAEQATAFRRVGAQRVEFDAAKGTIHFKDPGVRVDLGGIAKGYSVDAAVRALEARGVTDALVNLSGNMFALGTPGGGRPWRIGIRDPRDRVPYFARLPLTAGVSTSGKYEQFVAENGRTYGHIMDPRTGHPAEGLISVTVFAPSAFVADTWDTPLFVLGLEAAKRKARELPDVDAVLVAPGSNGVDTVWVERTLEGRFTLEPDARALFHVEYF
jgi:thiamine biosynthesis lipoprotein